MALLDVSLVKEEVKLQKFGKFITNAVSYPPNVKVYVINYLLIGLW